MVQSIHIQYNLGWVRAQSCSQPLCWRIAELTRLTLYPVGPGNGPRVSLGEGNWGFQQPQLVYLELCQLLSYHRIKETYVGLQGAGGKTEFNGSQDCHPQPHPRPELHSGFPLTPTPTFPLAHLPRNISSLPSGNLLVHVPAARSTGAEVNHWVALVSPPFWLPHCALQPDVILETYWPVVLSRSRIVIIQGHITQNQSAKLSRPNRY